MNEVPGPSSTQTTPPSEANLEALEELFPGVIQDGALDAGRLAEYVDVPVAGLVNGKESFGLMWPGRKNAVEAIHLESLAALVPDFEESIGWENAKNTFIEGDNLEVLKLLQNAYNDQVKLIYIDPPYNTGSDFVYNDDFSDPIQRYLEVTGQRDAEGNRLVANTETTGRRHANWLTMMYPRLMLARNLLTQDGAIFVSIDDNEVHHLRSLMDEVFGPENFIGQFVWAAGRKNDAKFVSTSHEYMIAYSRNYSQLLESVGEWRTRKSGLDEIYAQYDKLRKVHGPDDATIQKDLRAWYKSLSDDNPSKRHKQYNSVDSAGVFFASDASAPDKPETRSHRPLIHPVTGKPTAVPAKGWRWSDETLDRLVADGRIVFGTDESKVPQYKGYLVEREYEAPYSVFYQDGRGATKRLNNFLGGEYFDFPKDEYVLQNIVEFATGKESIVMDLFAGSGTTGHAVALQNEKDGGKRKYVLVTIDEPTAKGSFAKKQGIEKVSDITLMRLRKVLETIPSAGEMGLRVLRLGQSAFHRTPPIEEDGQLTLLAETLREGVSLEVSASEILLSSGLRLDEPWKTEDIGAMKFIRVGETLCQISPNLDESIIEILESGKCGQLLLLEDTFAGKDALLAKAYNLAKTSNVKLKRF